VCAWLKPSVSFVALPARHCCLQTALQALELSPIFGDGLKDQAAAVWD
jgi:hypothetical protein